MYIKNSNLKLIFFGSSEFSIFPLSKLHKEFGIEILITSPPVKKGRGLKIQKNSVHKKAIELGINKIFTPENLCDEEIIKEIKSINPHFIVLASYGKIIPSEILALPSKASINLHPSLLPKYRGAAPIQRALMNGEEKTGVTVILMTEKVDAGDILAQKVENISINDNYVSLSTKLSYIGAEILVEVLKNFDKIKPIKQNEKEASYARKIKKEERIINWQKDAFSVHNLVRALYGYMPATTFFREKRIEILETYPYDETFGAPGEIFNKGKRLFVSCGKGSVEILKLKPEGKKEIKGIDFLNGYRPVKGEKFGKEGR